MHHSLAFSALTMLVG